MQLKDMPKAKLIAYIQTLEAEIISLKAAQLPLAPITQEQQPMTYKVAAAHARTLAAQHHTPYTVIRTDTGSFNAVPVATRN